jgi:hypothetical protein
VLASSSIGALAWYSTQEKTSPPATSPPNRPPRTNPTIPALPSTTPSTRLTTTTSAPVAQACLESTEHPGAVNGASPEGFPWITFHVSPRAARATLVRLAQEAAGARQAFGDAGALGLRVYCDIEELAAASNRSVDEARARVAAGRVAYMADGDIWLYGPEFGTRPLLAQRVTVYHEYFHALQHSLSRSRASFPSSAPPLWLIEGTARYFENAVSTREMDNFRRTAIKRWQDLPALEELERSGGATSTGGSGHAYTVGAVATDYLVMKYGRELVTRDYWVALADADWRAAFLQVFGVSVETFYAEFATYRQGLPP